MYVWAHNRTMISLQNLLLVVGLRIYVARIAWWVVSPCHACAVKCRLWCDTDLCALKHPAAAAGSLVKLVSSACYYSAWTSCKQFSHCWQLDRVYIHAWLHLCQRKSISPKIKAYFGRLAFLLIVCKYFNSQPFRTMMILKWEGAVRMWTWFWY